MWSAPLLKALARLAAPGATVSTYSAAGVVRDGLIAAGFAVEKRAGFGRKRDMLAGRYAPRWPVRRPRAPPSWPERHAIVVGAGLSGAAVASRLAVRGWRIDLVEGGSTPSGAASALRAGVFQPHVSRDDGPALARFTRAGFLYALRAWASALDAAAVPPWQRCGVLQLADGEKNEARVADTAVALAHPVDYALHATRADATALAGRRAAIGGWWFPMAGFVRPAAIVDAQLGRAARSAGSGPAPVLHFDRNAQACNAGGDRWAARDALCKDRRRAVVVLAMPATPPGWSTWAALRCDEFAASKAICARRRSRRRASSSAAMAMCCRRSTVSPSRARLTISTMTIRARTP